ncbi:aminotransferase class V-fold PLP-dependent enzyme [Anaerobacillus isosaccharinicus]|uniref:Aminotransferase class V-fold PLP-dependent enzyme n=1 Tax=Anaerobacillus isosaccharinicus TaxID=1532552 RepID=A0A1S2LQU8_9BACI|nr:aminotransferase class V-fold PLP-dependent enzyme [Anaerobacillus isosaccharinicus]MBA5586219.1 aminotransferase class V-fold PLP-dependent enzyme [Anaerobacillus isosaccharinicus]QOY35523.1 aminotransferase class V-fold PLP-dependent enzyme [Anaerobacillus isosaccharinicus]
MSKLERYFKAYRKQIVGVNESYLTPFGKKKIIYADWIASGRLYHPIEKKLLKTVGPYVANTHTESNVTGTTMTQAYAHAHEIIKKHVNAGPKSDVIITYGFGMTGVVNKLQRMLGLRVPEKYKDRIFLSPENRPVVLTTHMEHHSNHTSWLETIADVVVIEPDENNQVSLKKLQKELDKYKKRKYIIGAFTSCSNVTGIETPYHKMAKLIHEYGGVCFVDFACSAPYVQIDMRPENKQEHLDAIYFSPHKFLGGPGTSGVLIFNKEMYKNKVPDNPGGGTVQWTNPWGGRAYFNEIEKREDGGTPGFLQAIKTALCIRLKEEMGVLNIKDREQELVKLAFDELSKIDGLHILQGDVRKRLGVISFYVDGIHYNLLTKLLCDRFGIQVRGGCACAGTYGHYLFGITPEQSKAITEKIEKGDLSTKPGWVRLSLHPTMTNAELLYVTKAIKQIVANSSTWERDYRYDRKNNEFYHWKFNSGPNVEKWFEEG